MTKTVQKKPSQEVGPQGVSFLELACYGIGYLFGALFKGLMYLMRVDESSAQKYRKEEIPAFMRKSGISLFAWQEEHLKPIGKKIWLLGYEKKLLAYDSQAKS